MTKKYYEILEISENATAQEIKKAYRKQALKYHPDKQGNKSLEERQKANDRMREVNQAFEVLGDEEKKRRYDLGEFDFNADFGGYDYEAEIKEETRRKEEELRRAKVERMDIELEILKLEMKSLDRSSTISEISAAFSFTYPRVFKENLDSKL